MNNFLENIFENVRITRHFGGKTSCGPNWMAKNEVLSCDKLYYILEGECYIEVGGKRYKGVPGMIFYIPMGTPHSFCHTQAKTLKKYWLHFSFTAMDKSVSEYICLPYYVNVGRSAYLEKMFEEALEKNKPSPISTGLLFRAAIMNILAFYIEQAGGRPQLSSGFKGAEKAILYMMENIGRSVTVQELADYLHLHRSHFIRYFKKQTGITPIKYINNLKFDAAKSLLQNTDITISEIMEKTGFNDLSHFSKFFKSYSGYSPRRFRENFREKPQAAI